MLIVAIFVFLHGYVCTDLSTAQQDNHSQSTQQQTSAKNNNSYPSPIADIDSMDRNQKTAANEEYWYDKLDKNRFLLFVGFLQLAVFTWQGCCLRATIKATKMANDIANKAFLATHQPKIILRDAYAGDDTIDTFVNAKYVLANVGNSPATIIKSAFEIKCHKTRLAGFYARTIPEVTNSSHTVNGVILQPGEHQVFEFTSEDLRWGPHNGTTHDAQEQYTGMFFSGRIVYKDSIGIIREMAFCRRYRNEYHRFFRVDDKQIAELEYE